jgi:intracellular sulfur oxidation DsrE/DsrF family protein
MNDNHTQTTARRGFLAKVAGGLAAIGLAGLTKPIEAIAQEKKGGPAKTPAAMHPADVWFNKVKGSHRVVYDSTEPHEIMPFAWSKVFLMTNEATGSPKTDCGVVVVLRHAAIGYAFQDEAWSKYNFTELFNAKDHGPAFQAADAKTGPLMRNPFWNVKHGDFALPGIGAVDIGIKDLQNEGVMFCVCNAAMTVYSNIVAQQKGITAEEVMKDWMSQLIPGIQVVPSGVWALGRAQEHGCKYIFAG